MGETFKTPNNGISYKITSVKFYVRKVGSPGTFAFGLYAHTGTYGSSGVPTGNALATSTYYTGSNFSTDWGLFEGSFNATNQYVMSPNTAYTIYFYAVAGTCDGANGIQYEGDTTSPPFEGNYFYYKSSTWYSDNSKDLCFYVYGALADDPPTFSDLSHSTTVAGSVCHFQVTGDDDDGLSSYIFSTNNTGSWVNNTAIAFTSTPQSV